MDVRERYWDALVVGSGLGGLTCAARLATQGMRVLVLEQHTAFGGYAHQFLRRVRGTSTVYDFDISQHQLGDLRPGRVLHDHLQDLGVWPRLRIRSFESAYRHSGPAHDLEIPADADAFLALLTHTFPAHARGLRALFATLGRVYCRSARDLNGDAVAALSMSLAELIALHVRDERISTIVSALWGYMGCVPSELSAFAYAQMWGSYHLGGCHTIDGGGHALASALVDVLRRAGGEVLLRACVARIETSNGRVNAVETERYGRFSAPVVISNASPSATFDGLLDDRRYAGRDRARCSKLRASISIVQTYVGVRGDAAELGLKDRHHFADPDYDLDGQWRAIQRGDHLAQGVYLANHSLSASHAAPVGRTILHAAVLCQGEPWLALDDAAYREKKRELEHYLIERLARFVPDLRARIEICETGTPRTMHRYTGNLQGAIYGYAPTVDGHGAHRPRPRTSIPGLYLASAWTFPGGGYQGAIASGMHTASLVMKDLALSARTSGAAQ